MARWSRSTSPNAIASPESTTSGLICAEAARRLRPLTTQQAEQPTSVGTTSVGTGATDSDGDIVVSPRHRNESSQGGPVAISVVGGDHIDSTGAFYVGRLQQRTPALQFYSSNPRDTSVNVRGVGSPLGLTKVRIPMIARSHSEMMARSVPR